ncbi:uncharacterized protein [Gossypium hirsutum]|uniref:Uncharacterized protein isoform X1 n=1 Tax=Gossypium hirsutum TaxID=3635 RepID=A0ABM3AHJ8_GOSHI|nr:uncharacterized protein LOC121203595 isoform X1 [Gossypium hirsutum]XP_040954295.1 uncharacterized protein LOC121203595 isoform X1 [Gossypium hirsutum]
MCLRRKRRGETGVKNLLGCQDFSPHISYYQPRRRSRRLLVKRRIKINSHSCSLVILFRSLVCFQDYPKSATKETTLLDGPLTKHPASPETGEEPTVRRRVIRRAGHRTRSLKITPGMIFFIFFCCILHGGRKSLQERNLDDGGAVL